MSKTNTQKKEEKKKTNLEDTADTQLDHLFVGMIERTAEALEQFGEKEIRRSKSAVGHDESLAVSQISNLVCQPLDEFVERGSTDRWTITQRVSRLFKYNRTVVCRFVPHVETRLCSHHLEHL